MKKIIAVLMSMCVILCFVACGNTEDTEKVSNEKIKTPYCELTVPESFDKDVIWEETSAEPYVLTFKTKDGKKVFALHFDDETKNLLGTLPMDDKNVVVYATFAKVKEKSEDYDKIMSYQEGINTIIEGLIDDYDFIVNEIVEHVDDTTYDIETSVATLKYPNRWKDKVKVDVSDKKVKFSNDGTPLFDLVFEKCDNGYLLGTYKDTPIYIVDYSVKTDEQAVMQEDVNVILQNLMEDSNFTISE